MKSMKGEVELKIAAEKAWEMYRDNGIISKINPDMLAAAHYVHGDGSPGSLRIFTLGPAVRSYIRESIEHIEKVEIDRSVTYRVIGGDLRDMYDPYKVTFTFIPIKGKENEQCIAQWKAEFEPHMSETSPPHKARDAALRFFKSFKKFKSSYSTN